MRQGVPCACKKSNESRAPERDVTLLRKLRDPESMSRASANISSAKRGPEQTATRDCLQLLEYHDRIFA